MKLTKTEEDIMLLIWETGPCTVSVLLEKMPEPRPPHSTVSSVVRILEKKGFVGHKAYGKTYEYFPLVSREEYGQRSVSDLVSQYFGGSVSRLVSQLLDDKRLSDADRAEILKKLDEL
jgi:BlaI family transcriptional regulator, penicillinase repressor